MQPENNNNELSASIAFGSVPQADTNAYLETQPLNTNLVTKSETPKTDKEIYDSIFGKPSPELAKKIKSIDDEGQFFKPIATTDVYKFNPSTNPISKALFGDYTSRYTKFLPNADNETINAQQQTGLEIFGNAVGGFLFNAGEAFSGYIGANFSAASAVANGDYSKLWDTEFSKNQAKDLATASDYFAIYSDATKNNGLSAYIPFTKGSAGKWGHLAQSFGFTVGTLWGVGLENAFLSATTGFVGNLAKSGKTMKGVYDAFRMLSFADKSVDAIRGANSASKIASNVWDGIKYTKISLTAAAAESSMEGAMAANEFENEEIEKYRNLYGQDPSDETLKEIQKRRESVGDRTFSMNMPILMASNFAMFGNFMRTGRFFNNPTNKVLEDAYAEGTKAAFKKGIAVNAWKASKKVAGVMPEGMEELSQSIASESAKRQYSMFNTDASKTFIDTVASTTKDLARSGRLAEDFVSGALIGGVTMGVGYINDKFKGGNKLDRDAVLNEYNTTFSENVNRAIDSLGKSEKDRKLPGSVFAGTQTGNNLIVGMESMNTLAHQVVASANKDKKQFYDAYDDGLKAIHYAGKINGASELNKELINASIDAIPSNEYASQYMTEVNPSESAILEHKEKKKSEFALGQDRFDEAWDKVDFKYGNPVDRTKNPQLHQEFEEVKRDIAFYKIDYINTMDRHKSINASLSTNIKKYYEETGIEIQEKDIDVIVSHKEREKEISKLADDAKAIRANIAALEGTVHDEQKSAFQEQLNAINERMENLIELRDASLSAELIELTDNESKLKYQSAVNKWLKQTTKMEFGTDNPLMNDIRDTLILNSEAKFLLTLHNALMSNGRLLKKYSMNYSMASRKARKEYADKLREEAEQQAETEQAPKAKQEKTLEDDFTPEQIAEMQEVLGTEDLYNVPKEKIQAVIDELKSSDDTLKLDLIDNLTTLLSNAYTPPKEIATEEQKEQAEKELPELKEKENARKVAMEIEANKNVPQEEYDNFIDNGTVPQERINSIADKIKNNSPLDERENAIFTAKTEQVNTRLVELESEATSSQTEQESQGMPLIQTTDVEQPLSDINNQDQDVTIPDTTQNEDKTYFKKIVAEIKSLPLTHVPGLQMGANQAKGMYISTEKSGNRYATSENPAIEVSVEISSPYVSEDAGLIDLRNKLLNENRDEFTREDNDVYENFPNRELNIDDLSPKGRDKLAQLVTEHLSKLGYDSIYWRESDTLEGELVVFDRKNAKSETLKTYTNNAEEKTSRANESGQKNPNAVDKRSPRTKSFETRKKELRKQIVNHQPSNVIEAIYIYFLGGGKIKYSSYAKDVFGFRVDSEGNVIEKYKKKAFAELKSKMAIIKKDGKSLSRIAEEVSDMLPESMEGIYESDVIDYLARWQNFDEVYEYFDRLFNGVDESNINEEKEYVVNEFYNNVYDILTDEEKELINTADDFNELDDIVERKRKIMQKIENAQNNPFFEQRVSKAETLSPSQMQAVRKLLSRVFPNIIEMTDEEVYKAMNGRPLPIGMMFQGKIWINSERENMETRMHEIGGHAFFAMIKEQYPSLYNDLMGKLSSETSNKELNEVKASVREFYPELEENSEEFDDEVMATYMGRIMRDGVSQAIKNKGIKSDIAYWINYLYERLMNLLGIDNYLDVDNFANSTLGENLARIGDGMLNGRIRSSITSEELGAIMSASPTYMKGITKEYEDIKKAIDVLENIPKVQKEKKLIVNQNKIKDDFNEEKDGNFVFISLYDLGVNVDEVMVSEINSDQNPKIVEKLGQLTNEPIDGKELVQVFYSNGVDNILTDSEINQLEQLGIRIYDSSMAESYARGRIFFYKQTPSNVSIVRSLKEIAGISFSEKRGVHSMMKNGKPIISTSDLSQKVNKEALAKVKRGDEIAVSIDFDNEWNQAIVGGLMSGMEADADVISTLVLTYKNAKGEILGYARATEGYFDQVVTGKGEKHKKFLRMKQIRTHALEVLLDAIENNKLATTRTLSFERELAQEGLSEERKALLKDYIKQSISQATVKDFLPIDLLYFNAMGTQAIYNENLDDWMSISDFLERRKEVNGDQDFQLAYYRKNENGEWRYFNKKGKELDIPADNYRKWEAVYLVSPNYQRRVYFETREQAEIGYNEFQELDASTVFTRLSPEKPYLDVRLKLDFEIEQTVDKVTSNIEEAALNEQDELTYEQEQTKPQVEVNKSVIDDAVESTEQIEPGTPQASGRMTASDEEFIYNLIPMYFGLDVNNELVYGENGRSYAMQSIMVDEMNDGLVKTGLRLTQSVAQLPRKAFKNILNSYQKYKLGDSSLKNLIFDIVNYKKAMDNDILIEGDNLVLPANTPEGGRIVRIDNARFSKLELLYDMNDIYIQHEDTNFYYEFPKKKNVAIEKQVKDAIRRVMMANGERMSNFEAYYTAYTRTNIELALGEQTGNINLVRVAVSPYTIYKLTDEEGISDEIKCI